MLRHSNEDRTVELYVGDLPHPDIVRGYNESYDKAAETIFRMAEKAHEQQIQIQNKQFRALFIRAIIQQVSSITFSIFALFTSYSLIQSGKSIAGYVTLIGTLLGFLAAIGASKQKNENK